MLAKARGSNTINLYTRRFSKWQQWINQFPNIQVIPADNTHVIACILKRFQRNKSLEILEFHFLLYVTFKKSQVTKTLWHEAFRPRLERMKRPSQKIVCKKLLLTTEHLHKLYKTFGGKNINLKDFRTNLICSFLFMRFLRHLRSLKLKNFWQRY